MGATYSHVCRAHSLYSELSSFKFPCSRPTRPLQNHKLSCMLRLVFWDSHIAVCGGVWLLPKLRVRTQNIAAGYEVSIGRGALRNAGHVARVSLGDSARKVAIVSNAKV